MAHGQPQGEEVYRPEVPVEDLPRKTVPEIRDMPLAQGVSSLANNVADVMQKKYVADSATYAGDQLAAARVKAASTLETLKSQVPDGQDPGDFTQKFLTQFDKDNDPLGANAIGNPVAARMMHRGLSDLRTTLAIHAQDWEANQRVAYRSDSVVKNTDDQLATIEAHPELASQVGSTIMDQIHAIGGDPNMRLKLGQQMHEKVSLAAAQGTARQDPRGMIDALDHPEDGKYDFMDGLTDQQRETIRGKAESHLTDPVYQALSSNDTKTAQTALNANKDILNPKTTWSVQRTIDAQVKEKENEAKQDIADRYQDSLKAAEFGLPNSAAVTRSELNVLYPKDSQRHWDILQAAQQSGAAAKEYDRMPAADVLADVDKSKPTEGGREAAIGIESYEVRAKAAERSIRERQADPAAFAQKNGSWDALDFSDPQKALQQIGDRAKTQDQVSAQIGVPTPLVSKPETKALTDWLGNQNADQKMATLQALRKTLPSDQAYTGLLDKIAPGSPLTAIVGTMQDKPQGAQWYQDKFATNPLVGQRILEGDAMLAPRKNEKGEMVLPKFPMPEQNVLMPSFTQAMGGSDSDLFRGRPETQSAYEAAFRAAYAAEASHQGKTSGVLDQGIADSAARAVLGHTAQYGFSTVTVPAGMDPTHFEGNVNGAVKATLAQAGYTKADISGLHGFGLRELGDTLGTGKYKIINGTGDPLKDKSGRDVIIDLNQQYASQAEPEQAQTTLGGNHGH